VRVYTSQPLSLTVRFCICLFFSLVYLLGDHPFPPPCVYVCVRFTKLRLFLLLVSDARLAPIWIYIVVIVVILSYFRD